MVEDRYNQRRSPSLSGPSRSPAPAAPAKPAAPAAKPVNTSSFLTRIANTAIREAGGAAPASAASPKWMGSSIDHSSPAANLSSRLRWVETAFKQEGAPQVAAQRPTQQMQQAPQQAAVPKPHIADAGDFRAAVILMRKRMQAIHLEMEALDKELAEIEQKMGQAPAQQ